MPYTTRKLAPRLKLVITKPGFTRTARRSLKRMHHYKPGVQLTPRPGPRDRAVSVPSAASVPPPSPLSKPLSMGFDDNYGLRGLEADTSGNWFTDILTAATEGYKAKQQAKAAAAGAIMPSATMPVSTRPMVMPSPGPFGLSTTTWLMLAGAGLGAYLLLGRKKRRSR